MSQLDCDAEDETALKQAAMANAQHAIKEAQDRAKAFDRQANGGSTELAGAQDDFDEGDSHRIGSSRQLYATVSPDSLAPSAPQPTQTDKPPPEQTPRQTRKRSALNCTPCRRRKRKCDRQLPCSSCVKRDERDQCFYQSMPPRAPAQDTTADEHGCSGGGMGGLFLGLCLKKYASDVDFDIYEAATELTEIGAGITMSPRTWSIMKELGLREEILPTTGTQRPQQARFS